MFTSTDAAEAYDILCSYYDNENSLTQINSGAVTAYQYNAANAQALITPPTGAPTTQTFDPFGTPPLKLAVLCGAHRTVSRLLAAGANPDVEDVYYETPLICAIRRNDQTSVEILLAHGASVNLKTINGKSAFDYARKLDNRIIVELLRRYDRLERSGRSASKPTTNTTHRSHVIPSAEQLNGTDLPLPE